jgi:hypothetical protein
MSYPQSQYDNYQKAKTLSIYTLDNADHILTKQEDGMMGYIAVSDITSYINLRTAQKLGWARYDDTLYTTSSAFTASYTNGEYTLPNNAGNTIETHLHSTISFYNSGSQKIQVENEGDVYMCTVVFKAKTPNANSCVLRLQMDSTGDTPYQRVGKDLFFGKGNDEWHDFHEVFQWYADADFVTNGNRWKIEAVGANAYISNVIFFIQRTQNHSV